MSWNYHFWAWFWPNFNFVDFRAYFRPFSLVKRAKNKIAFLQQKKCSNKKSEENKPTLKFNFLWKSKCASLYFQFWVLGANLDEPYCPGFLIRSFTTNLRRRWRRTGSKARRVSFQPSAQQTPSLASSTWRSTLTTYCPWRSGEHMEDSIQM